LNEKNHFQSEYPPDFSELHSAIESRDENHRVQNQEQYCPSPKYLYSPEGARFFHEKSKCTGSKHKEAKAIQDECSGYFAKSRDDQNRNYGHAYKHIECDVPQ
jgi:hypothetical protein